MRNSFIYLIVLAVGMLIASWMHPLAQDDNMIILDNTNLNSKILNNTTLNNKTLHNASIDNISSNNISFTSNSLDLLTDASLEFNTQPMKLGSDDNATFIISSNMTVVPSESTKDNVSGQSSEIQPPKKTIFMIDFVRPGSSSSYENGSFLNGAYLSRKVEGTPHGYVTYHN